MARAKKTGDSAELSISHSFGSTLFDALQVPRLRLLFEQLFPDRRVTQRGPSTLLMNCVHPRHVDSRPSFYVYANINYAECKACNYRTRNPLELLRDSLGFSYIESLSRIQEITGHRVASEKIAKQLEGLDINQQAVRYVGEAMNEHLQLLIMYMEQGVAVSGRDSVYYNDSLFHGVKPTLEWLFRKRQLSPDKVPYLPYGIVPSGPLCEEHVNRLLNKDWEYYYRSGAPPSAYTKERKELIAKGAKELFAQVPVEYSHAVGFMTGHSPNTAGRLRLRRVNNNDTSKDHHFWNTPAYNNNEPLGFVGLYSPRRSPVNRQDADMIRTVVFEGEIEMLRYQEHVIENSIPDTQCLATSGSINDLDALYTAGVTNVDIVPDHPDPRYGRGEEWLKGRLGTAFHLRTRVFSGWEPMRGDVIAVKDPDDVLSHYGWAHARKFLFDEVAKNFESSDIWASRRAIEDGIQISEDDTRGRLSKAAEYGQCVRHPALLSNFVTKVSQALGLAPAPLRSEIVKANDDEAGFIARVVETLTHEFVPLYKHDSARGGVLELFHRQSRRYISLPVSDGNAMMATLSNVFGEMYSYFKDHIGLPHRDENVPGSAPLIRDGQKYVADYLKIAAQSLYHGVPSQEEAKILGGGIHYQHSTDTEPAVARIHAGNRWYKITYREIDDTYEKVEELPGPVDEQYSFAPHVAPWSKSIQSVEDIEEGLSIGIPELARIFKSVVGMFREHWKFLHPLEDSEFLASMAFVMAAGDAFDSKTLLRIVGPSNSGKSTAMAVLAGGQNPDLQLVEMVLYMANYTMAAITQNFSGSSMSMALDEFSSAFAGSVHKGQQVDNITEFLRQVPYAAGAPVIRYGSGGRVIKSVVRTHAIMTSVHEPRDTQDASRSYTIETVKDDKVRDPNVGVLRQFGLAGMAAMRRAITLGILKYLPRLRRYQMEIHAELNTRQFGSYLAPSRFLRNFSTVAAIQKLLGLDWEASITRMIDSRKERLTAQASSSMASLVYDRAFRTAIVRPPGNRDQALSAMQLLITPDGHMLLNASGIGLLYNPGPKYVVIDWVAATSLTGVFYRMPDFARMTPQQLKHQLDQHPDIVRPSQYGQHNVMEFLAANSVVVAAHEISVIDVSRVRESILRQATNYTGPALTKDKHEGEGQEPTGNANNM